MKLKGPAGDAWINLDNVSCALPANKGGDDVKNECLSVITDGKPVLIFRDDFEKAIALVNDRSPNKDVQPMLLRLIQALDRLTVHIPTSIRLHM